MGFTSALSYLSTTPHKQPHFTDHNPPLSADHLHIVTSVQFFKTVVYKFPIIRHSFTTAPLSHTGGPLAGLIEYWAVSQGVVGSILELTIGQQMR